MIGKFLGKWFLVEFIQNELILRWNVQGDFHASTLYEGVLLFDLPSEEIQARILAIGP